MAILNFASSTEDRASGSQIIEGSVKINSALNARLERTPSAAGNRMVYTISVWCKNTLTSSGSQYIFDAKGPTGVNGENPLCFDSGRLRHNFNNGSDIWDRTSTKYFRDTGWYHVVASVDMTLATQDDRVRTFVNGVRITDFTQPTNFRPNQNSEAAINDDGVIHAIGWWINGASREYDGYLSQFHLIDGSALEPTDFGYTDLLTNTWRPKKFTRDIPNQKGRTFSSTVTASSNSWGGGTGPEKAFNGSLGDGFNNGAGGQWITFDTSSYKLSGNLRCYCKSSSGLYDIYVNGNSTKVADTGSSYAWVDCGTHAEINEIQWAGTAYGGNNGLGSAGVYVAAIMVDGVMLINDRHQYGLNGSFLPLDGVLPLGQDQSGAGNNWKLMHVSDANYPEKATGALPIFNTINGGRTATPTVRGVFPDKIVTVASSKFVVDGVSQASLQLLRGGTYKFDQSDSSNSGHPLRFSTTDNGSHGGGSEYTDGRVTNGTPGSAGAYTIITVPHNAANTLYYFCSDHSGMGGDMSVTTDVTKADPHAWKCTLALPLLANTVDYSNTLNCTTTAKSITTVGNSTPSFAQHNVYGGSYYFDGSSDCLHAPDNNDWEPGSGDFTMEMWVRRFRVDSDEWLMIQSDGTSAGSGVGIHIWASNVGTANQFAGRMRIGGSNIDCNGSTKLEINTWYHLAFTREGDKGRVFVNGQLDGEVTNGGAINAPSTPMIIGAVNNSGAAGIKGWIQDVRFYKGVAKYTKDFIPATSSPDILPETPSGTAYSSQFKKLTGQGCVSFDGLGNYLRGNGNGDFVFATGDFCIEGFFYFSEESGFRHLIDFRPDGADGPYPMLRANNRDIRFGVNYPSTGDLITATNAITVGTWYHIAATRASNTVRLFVNGRLVGSGTESSNIGVGNNRPMIGGSGYHVINSGHQGFISNVRIVKGSAVYTAAFNPPTEPLTSISGTALLCCQSNTSTTAAAVGTVQSMYLRTVGINTGRVWSQDGSVTNPGVQTSDCRWPTRSYRMFQNRNKDFFSQSTGVNGTTTYNFSGGGVPFTTSVRIAGSNYSGHAAYANGTSVSLDGGNYTNPAWVNITSSISSPLTSVGTASNGSQTATISRIEVDGVILEDGEIDGPHVSQFNPFSTEDLDSVRGQETGYATLNYNDSGPIMAVTDGGLKVMASGGNNHQFSPASIPYPQDEDGNTYGKWYCEFTTNSVASDSCGVSVVRYNAPDFTVEGNSLANGNNYEYSWTYECRDKKYFNGADGGAAYGQSFLVEGDTIGCAVDFTGTYGKVSFYLNGVYQGVFIGSLRKDWQYIVGVSAYGGAWHQFYANFGQKPFQCPPPEGHKTLCAANLPRPAIVRPDKYVKPVTWTGTTANDIIVDCGFQPDLVFMKSRTQTYGWYWYDSVRGGTNGNGPPVGPDDKQTALFLNSTGNAAETNANTDQIVMTPTGFVVDKDGQGIGEAGQGANNMVGYAFRAGGWKGTWNLNGRDVGSSAAAGLTAGTTSILNGCSINTKAGFSIVKWTQDSGGAAKSIAHGLNRAPQFVIMKHTNSTSNWFVSHTGLSAATKIVEMNSTGAESNSSDFGNAFPTSTVVTTNTTGVNGRELIMYMWHDVPGLQKFGKYKASAASSAYPGGPFVYCGFRPAIVMYKNTSSTEAWSIVDASQDPDNPQESMLLPSATNSKLTSNAVDLLSNGFKVRTTNNPNTGDNHMYVYAAWAEAPLNILYGAQSNAR